MPIFLTASSNSIAEQAGQAMAPESCQDKRADEGGSQDGGSDSPGLQEMRTFLDLDTPTSEAFPPLDDICPVTTLPSSSFLLSSSASSVVSFTAADASVDIDAAEIVTIASSKGSGETVDSIVGSPSPSFASFPSCGTTITSCASSRSSMSSQFQRSLLSENHSLFLGRGTKVVAAEDNEDMSDGNCEYYQQQEYHGGMRRRDRYLLQSPNSTPKRPVRIVKRRNSSMQSSRGGSRSSTDERCCSRDGRSSSISMTREEFEALPLTVQRKYFSTLERLRIIRSPSYNNDVERNVSHSKARSISATLSIDEETVRLGFGRDELENAPHRRSQLNQKPLRVYDSPKRRSGQHRGVNHDIPDTRNPSESVILDAADESILRLGSRRTPALDLDASLGTLRTLRRKPGLAKMGLSKADDFSNRTSVRYMTDSLIESFRWLEDGDDLDLRLLLDGFEPNQGVTNIQPQMQRKTSHRRHLTVSKLPLTGTKSRPILEDVPSISSPTKSPQESVLGSSTQGLNRRSRALSLSTPGRHAMPEKAVFVDPSAAHYQDPDARRKLRVYLASPHKFDEAIEFGFPSIEEVQGGSRPRRKPVKSQRRERAAGGPGKLKLSSFIEDDKSSLYSDEASTLEPESPQTPSTPDKLLAVKPFRTSRDGNGSPSKVDYAQAPASSREMTLRMTLTRPDLRANEDQIYGWQKMAPARVSQAKDEPLTPLSSRGHSKESIERQFAAIDQEELMAINDNGVMKRFWNRMRRS